MGQGPGRLVTHGVDTISELEKCSSSCTRHLHSGSLSVLPHLLSLFTLSAYIYIFLTLEILWTISDFNMLIVIVVLNFLSGESFSVSSGFGFVDLSLFFLKIPLFI